MAALEKEYAHYIQVLDAEVHLLKVSYPNKFWRDDDPKYKEMTDVWAAKREEMKASGVKLPSYIAEQRKKPTSVRRSA